MENYFEANQKLWSGRTNSTGKPQYWYEHIKFSDFRIRKFNDIQHAILGYVCDEGVRRNQGRVGAAAGPDAIRRQLGKLPFHSNLNVADFGNVKNKEDSMEACQETFADMVSALIQANIRTIGLGGGHDIAYAHLKGIEKALAGQKKKIGILNFDAHFDLRRPENDMGTSGTPFHQILSDWKNSELRVDYLAIGIQRQGNTPELFDIANEFGVQHLFDFYCKAENFHSVHGQIKEFIAKQDLIYLTIDLDGFSSVFAPGVSAVSPFGLAPDFVRSLLPTIVKSGKLIACDIAELNPTYDQDNVTARLAARLVDIFVYLSS